MTTVFGDYTDQNDYFNHLMIKNFISTQFNTWKGDFEKGQVGQEKNLVYQFF